MTPDMELQRAVRLALIATPDVAAHITPERIRAGIARPEDVPVIIMTPASVEILGHAAGGQKVAEIAMRLHIWTEAGQADTAQQITSAAMLALMDKLEIAACTIEEWDRPAMVWVPDPDPALSFSHAVIALRAVIYWRAS